MAIYRARLRNNSNALSPRVSSEQIRLQVPPKLFGVDSWTYDNNKKAYALRYNQSFDNYLYLFRFRCYTESPIVINTIILVILL